MTEEYQIEVPPSFIALYLDARNRLTDSMAVVRARYEVCEDLSQMLVDQAEPMRRDNDLPQRDVMLRIHAGLSTPAAGVSPPEAEWIVRRLAELLNWTCPELPGLPDAPSA